MNNKIKELKINQLRSIVFGSSLNFLERGELYFNTCKELGLSGRDLAYKIGKYHRTVNREIKAYKNTLNLPEFNYTEISKTTPDRELMRILDSPKKKLKSKDIDYYLEYYGKYKRIGFSNITSILNGTLDIVEYKERQQNNYKELMLEIKNLELELKLKQNMEK